MQLEALWVAVEAGLEVGTGMRRTGWPELDAGTDAVVVADGPAGTRDGRRRQ